MGLTRIKKIIIIFFSFLSIVGIYFYLFEKPKLKPKLGGITETIILDRIAQSQEIYFQKNGIYWQGLTNRYLKSFYQKESMSDLIDMTDIPIKPEIQVDQYKAPNNQFGFQVIFIYPDKIKSFGYGIEANSRTWENIILQGIASTTNP